MNHQIVFLFLNEMGLRTRPPQLELQQVSPSLRKQIEYYLLLEVERERKFGYDHSYFDGGWKRVTTDFHVLFLGESHQTYKNSPYDFEQIIGNFTKKANFNKLFDFVEFFLSHPNCSSQVKSDLATTFSRCKAAYRVAGSKVVAVGSEEQANALEKALADAKSTGVTATRTHLILAGQKLREGDWADSVRESIHAVEAMSRNLSGGSRGLASALDRMESKGLLHRKLKSAFKDLYSYTSDEEGVRHALVYENVSKVDEADALFMLGACASFVSYLAARGIEGESKG